MNRSEAIARMATLIATIERPHPVRVALDGIDAAGKTTLASELVAPLEAYGRPVIRATIDAFHYPRAQRYRRGRDSPEGCYFDTFNYDLVKRYLLIPLGPGGHRLYRTAAFDYRTDQPVNQGPRLARPDAILLLDGVFLLRPELKAFWDYAIFVAVTFSTALARSCRRVGADQEAAQEIRRLTATRYRPAQLLYFQKAAPKMYADVIFDNNDLEAPQLLPGKNSAK